MEPSEKLPTIRRDLVRLYKKLEAARSAIDRGTSQGRVAWTHVDDAIALMQGLLLYVGPFSKEEIEAGEQEEKQLG